MAASHSSGPGDDDLGHDHDHEPGHDHGHEHAHEHRPAEPTAANLARFDGIDGHVIRRTSECGREILAVIPAAQVEAEVERMAARLARKVTLKGFRPGKAPVPRIKVLYAEELRRDALEGAVGAVVQEALTANKERRVGQPTLTEMWAPPGAPIRCAARFEVLPDIRLQGLDSLTVDDKPVSVSDGDVDEELEGIRASRAEIVESTRADAAPGVFAQVRLERWAPESDREGEPQDVRESVLVEVGAATAMPELDRALQGMTPGETRTFETTYPQDHSDPALAGKAVPFRITLQALRDRKLPALDDALAGAVGVSDLATLRAEIKTRLLEVRTALARREQEQGLLAQLMAKNAFTLPESLVNQETENRIRRALQRLSAQGLDLDKARIDWDTEERRVRESAERDLKAEYLLELIALEKGVTVEEADLNAEIEVLAKQRNTAPHALRGELERSKRMSELESSLRRRRVLDLLRSSATIPAT